MNKQISMRAFLRILAIVAALSFISGYASARTPLYEIGERAVRESQQYELEQQAARQRALSIDSQRRMNQQYYNDQLQGEIRRQQDDMWYLKQQEHMRNQGWGRPGLDDGGLR